MAKNKKNVGKKQNALDKFSGKRGRGRPYKVRSSEVHGRSYNYRLIFGLIWDELGDQLLKAKTKEEVIKTFEQRGYKEEFEGIASLFLSVLHDPDFPKRDKEARINFLADSLAARGWVTPRSSRDICARERAVQRKKSAHRVLRHEFYIECSCSYKGPARDNACPRCSAEIDFLPSVFMGRGLF